MKKILRVTLLLVLLFGIIEPVAAVFEERDLTQTLRVLKVELRRAHKRTAKSRQMIRATRQSQQKQMVELMEECNELAIILYSQKQNFTFDLTYALEEVSDRYHDFSRNRRPFTDIIAQIDIEIERYQKLIHTLKRLPPALIDELDTLGGTDSTIILASQLQEEIRSLHQKNAGKISPGVKKKEDQQDNQQAPEEEEDDDDDDDDEKEYSGSILRSLAKTIFTGSVDQSDDEEFENGNKAKPSSDTSYNSAIIAVSADGRTVNANPEDSAAVAQNVEYAFLLTGKSLQNRDSCIFYAQGLLEMYEASKESIVADSTNYDATWQQLQEAYNYAIERYNDVQKKIFIDGQTGYYTILSRFSRTWNRVKNDVNDKWAAANTKGIRSQWRLQTMVGLILFVLFYLGISVVLSHLIIRLLKKKIKYFQTERFRQHGICLILLLIVTIFGLAISIAMLFSQQNFLKLATRLLVEFAWLLGAIFLSFTIRLRGDQVKSSIRAYLPIMVLCLIIIFIRISFSPNTLINIILPPLLLIFTYWQWRICSRMRYTDNTGATKRPGLRRLKKKSPVVELGSTAEKKKNRHLNVQFPDYIYNYITLTVLTVTTILSLSGYVLLSILIIIWWIFQLSVIQTITAASDLLKIYYDRYMVKRKMAYRINHGFLINLKVKGSYIEVTWLYDILRKAVIPFFTVWSIPLCLYMASNVFDLSNVAVSYLKLDFLSYKVINLSVTKILTAVSLAFVFNCIGYLAKAFYRVFKIRSVLARTGQKELPENMINFTLANSIISIITWGAYIITCFILLHIPSTAISIVSAGLATGIGFALKDVINNFFYGVSLMSGRLRVGDYVECDDVRGVVDSINYQSTLIETEYGSIMAFPNANLFQKNFKNLTRNNAYELLILPVGVQYGSDVAKVRELLKKALIKLNVKDKYGRNVLNPKYGIVVRLAEFGDSSIVLKVYQQVLVTERYIYMAAANETIYNTLNANGITIPFPQRDVYIKQVLSDKAKEEDADSSEEGNPHPDKKHKWFL
ncbi:MAG: mechanosensitive ion channel family protein [Bacteroidales bacterium]|nr:mechanosensitive ion channel family protein [Bacteroidales bacterium]